MKFGLSFQSIFEELPIKIHNSHLVHGFLYELRENHNIDNNNNNNNNRYNNIESNRLTLNHSLNLEKTLNSLANSIDEFSNEQQRLQYYYRSQAKQKAAQNIYLQKKEFEREQRLNQGNMQILYSYILYILYVIIIIIITYKILTLMNLYVEMFK